jgi:hypothetical protein
MFGTAQTTILADAALCAISVTSSVRNWDRRVDVVSDAHLAIVGLHASDIDSDSWQADILGSAMLPPGKHPQVNLDDGSFCCRSDLQARFVDGTSALRHDVDICSIARYAMTGGSTWQ